jgi:hypothetical protein
MRCGIWYNRVDLRFQFDWRGTTLQNLYLLVCKDCYDEPQEQLRAIVLPADPVPIFYPSVEDFVADETNYRAVSYATVIDPITGIPRPSTTLRTTEDCQNRTMNPFGLPVGLNQNAVMPLQGTDPVHYGVPLNVLSVSSDGSATVTVTCSSVHNLHPDDQVSVQGLSYGPSCGFYSVSVPTATMFTYQTYGANPLASLLTPTTRIVNCKIGLPYGYKQIPKIYGPDLTFETCVFALEDGVGFMELESGAFLDLESCGQQPVVVCDFELENTGGSILLEDGTDSLVLEMCNG